MKTPSFLIASALTILFGAFPRPAAAADRLAVLSGVESYLGAGAGYTGISGAGSSITGLALNFDYRRFVLPASPLTASLVVAPTFGAASLSTVQVEALAGWEILGHPASRYELREGESPLASWRPERSEWQAFLDVGIALFPIFGSNATVTYSGATFGARIYHHGGLPLSASLYFSTLTSGTRSVSAFSFGVSYFFDLP
jgi:hypothetical protein